MKKAPSPVAPVPIPSIPQIKPFKNIRQQPVRAIGAAPGASMAGGFIGGMPGIPKSPLATGAAKVVNLALNARMRK